LNVFARPTSRGVGTITRNLSKSAFAEGVDHFERKFYVNGAIRLWTLRSRNDVATTLPLEVFTQRNFAADFFRQEVKFYWQKQQNCVLCHSLGGLRGNVHGSSISPVRKGVANFLLVLTYC